MEIDDLPLPRNAPDFVEARAAYTRASVRAWTRLDRPCRRTSGLDPRHGLPGCPRWRTSAPKMPAQTGKSMSTSGRWKLQPSANATFRARMGRPDPCRAH
jgi:hypothetical protein